MTVPPAYFVATLMVAATSASTERVVSALSDGSWPAPVAITVTAMLIIALALLFGVHAA